MITVIQFDLDLLSLRRIEQHASPGTLVLGSVLEGVNEASAALACVCHHSFEYSLGSQNEYLNIWMWRECKLALHIFPYVNQNQVHQLIVYRICKLF